MKHRKLTTTPEISKRMANIRLKAGKAETSLAGNSGKEAFDIARIIKNFQVPQI